MQGSLALDLFLGLGIGIVSGTFGITGGVIAVPILGFLGFGQHLAQGTSLVMQLPIGVIALWQYARRSRLDSRLIAAVAGGSAIATLIGARLAVHLPEVPMRRSFAVFLAALATFTICSAFWRQMTSLKLRWPSASAIGASGGFCSGLFGVGGAAFTIPSFSFLFGLSQTEAQGMGLAAVLPAIAIAIPTYTVVGFADWRVGLILGVGAVASVGFGVALAHKLPQRALRVALCVVLYAGSLGLWLRV
jgi:uncharacterized membrane protein YfcA